MPRTRAWDLYRGMLTPDDPEFAAKVGSNTGFVDRLPSGKYIDPSMAEYHPQPAKNDFNQLYGMWASPMADAAEYKKVQNEFNFKQPLAVGKVHAFGPEGANQNVWAHEYRHAGGVEDEFTNRLYDALFAGSEKQWWQAVRAYAGYMEQIEGPRYVNGHYMPKEAYHGDLVEALKHNFGEEKLPPFAKMDPMRMLGPNRPKPITKKIKRSKKR